MRKILLILITVFYISGSSYCQINLTVPAINDTDVVFSWDYDGCANNYTLRYREDGGSWSSGITIINTGGTEIYNLIGLTQSTTYNWKVKCGGGGTFVDGPDFTTLASCSLISSISVTDATCIQSVDGGATLTISGGTIPYTFAWDNGTTAQNLSAVPTDTFIVQITDWAGCTLSDTAIIGFGTAQSLNQQVTAFSPNPVTGYHQWSYDTLQINNTGCDVRIKPEFIISCSAGNIQQGDLVIKWQCPTSSTGLCNINYTIDGNGDAIGYWSAAPSDPTGTDISFGQIQDVVVQVKFVNPALYGTYTAIWETFKVDATGGHLGSLTSPDTITLSLIDCSTFSIDSISSANSCNGSTDGSATVFSIANGSGSYSYSWTDTAGTVVGSASTVSGLSAGTYSCIVTDNNCGGTDSVGFIITNPDSLIVSLTGTNISCNGMSDGSASATITSGGGSSGGTVSLLTYCTSTPGSSDYSNIELVRIIGDGDSIVNNTTGACDTYEDYTAQYTTLTPGQSYSVDVNLGTCAVGAGSIDSAKVFIDWNIDGDFKDTLEMVGVFGGIQSPTSNSISFIVPNGYYGATRMRVVSQMQGTGSGPVRACDVGTWAPTYTQPWFGATEDYSIVIASAVSATYLWSTGDTINIISNLDSGTYTLTVTNTNGCTDSGSITITEPAALVASAVIDNNVSCNGFSTGEATASAVGGTGSYSYLWDNGDTNQTADSLSAGIYTCTVTDANGCTDSASVTITEPGAYSVSVTGTHITCNGLNNGTVTATVSGGSGSFKYIWSPILGGNSYYSGLGAGLYILTVMDLGCLPSSAIDSFTIIEPSALTISSSSANNTSCDTANCNGSITISLSGGTQPYSYTWTNGYTDSIRNDLCGETYTIDATDVNSCITLTENITIYDSAFTPTALVIGTNISCNGMSDGSASAAITTGGGGISGGTVSTLSYCTSTPGDSDYSNIELVRIIGDGDSIVNNTTGACDTYEDYTAQYTTLTPGQSYSVDVNLGTCNAFGGTIDSAKVFIDWNIDGDFTDALEMVGVFGGVQSPTSNTISFIVPNGYYGATRMRVVSQAQMNNSGFPNGPVTSCDVGAFGTSWVQPWYGATEDYSIVISGVVPATYFWSTGDTTDMIDSLIAGTYYCEVTDTNNCSSIDTIIIYQPDSISTTAATTDVLCNGDSTGTAILTISGGTSPYSQNWGTSDSLALDSGYHTFTIIDAHGCIYIDTIIITQPDSLSATAATTDVLCNGDSTGTAILTISGGTSPYSENWGTSDSLALDTGYHTFTIIDAHGCIYIDSVFITQPDSLSVTAATTNVLCNGASTGTATLTINGGTPGFLQDWGLFNPDSLSAGTYPYTVTDTNGCTLTDSVFITQPDSLSATAATTDVLCNGDSTGTAILTISGGTSPYSQNWGTSDSLALDSGYHTFTIIDFNSCTLIDSILITQPDSLSATAATTDVLCNGDSTGTAILTISGGTSPYSENWGTSDSLALDSGYHTFTITDFNSCVLTDSIFITQPDSISTIAATTDVLCNGGATGTAILTISGGTPGFIQDWGLFNPDSLSAGTYPYTVTDTNGCAFSDSAQVSEPNLLAVTLNNQNVSCYDGANGKLSAIVTGGTAPFTYLWSNLDTNQTSDTLVSGYYVVTVTDAHACIVISDTMEITQPDSLYTTYTLTDFIGYSVSCFGDSNATIDVQINGGTPPFTHYFNGIIINNNTIQNLGAGTYTDSIIDNNGCAFTDTITLTEPANLNSVLSVINMSCNGVCDGKIISSVIGGIAPYSYIWNNSQTTNNLDSLCDENYILTITDTNGCTFLTDSVLISEPTAVVISLNAFTDVTVYGGNDGAIFTSASGGTNSFTYQWTGANSFSASTLNISNLVAGTYYLTATDSMLCSATDSFVVAQPPPPLTAYLDSAINLDCNGICTGELYITAEAGNFVYTYLWSGPNGYTSTAEDIDNLCAGAYTVDVSDTINTVTLYFTILEPTPLIIISIADTAICYNGTAQANAYAYGGNYPYQTLWWSNGSTNTSAILPAGIHTVSITDANGCIATDSVTVHQTDSISINSAVSNISCNGGTDGIGFIDTIYGGTPGYSYLWSTGEITAIDSNLTYGTYTVQITDVNGCSNTITLTISEPDELVSTITTTNVSCYEECDGTAILAVTGGTPTYNSNWGGANPNNLCAGFYNVIVTDISGCSTDPPITSFTITEPNPVIVTIWQNGNTIEATTGFVSYQWYDGVDAINGAINDTFTPTAQGEYSVEVIDTNGCSAISNSILIIIDYVNQNEIKLNIYPNPTKGLLIIETEEIIKNISIITTLGNELPLVENNNNSLNPTKLDLATFAKGIYFIKIELSSQIINYRIVLQ